MGAPLNPMPLILNILVVSVLVFLLHISGALDKALGPETATAGREGGVGAVDVILREALAAPAGGAGREGEIP